MQISGPARACISASVRSGRSASPPPVRVSEAPVVSASAGGTAGVRRLLLTLLLAPALLWLAGLIVLPHVDLALLSLRERVAPRTYVASFAQYRTFFSEPL